MRVRHPEPGSGSCERRARQGSASSERQSGRPPGRNRAERARGSGRPRRWESRLLRKDAHRKNWKAPFPGNCPSSKNKDCILSEPQPPPIASNTVRAKRADPPIAGGTRLSAPCPGSEPVSRRWSRVGPQGHQRGPFIFTSDSTATPRPHLSPRLRMGAPAGIKAGAERTGTLRPPRPRGKGARPPPRVRRGAKRGRRCGSVERALRGARGRPSQALLRDSGRFALTPSQHVGRCGSALLVPQVPREAWGCGSRAARMAVRVRKRSALHSGPRASRCELCPGTAPSALALRAQIGRKQPPQHQP